MTGSSSLVPPWPQDASVHPGCEIRCALPVGPALETAARVLSGHGYRVHRESSSTVVAELGGRLRAE
ncbi:hypothetical protein Cpa01nite_30300 [Cellulomonas pakistanensis]|uniref:Uncharacterized protein n=1 Tax=Cellulomonas pakistanensis TaxID=992287 RepID=A0A919PAW8_9CELL|nr:hypothetical protein Cpa01nite_30300 [Cellulomonas pakistanensis]